MESEQEHFLLLLRRGDERAYRKLFDDYYVMLCRIASQWVHNDYMAQTIVSDTLLHLWQARETLVITSSLRSYLIRSVRNASINHLRSEYHRREIPVSYSESEWEAHCQLADLSNQPLGILEEQELEGQINAAIDRLSTETRQVFRLCRMEGKTYAEAAETLNISVNTVKYHLKNAIKKLSYELSGYLYYILPLLFFNYFEK